MAEYGSTSGAVHLSSVVLASVPSMTPTTASWDMFRFEPVISRMVVCFHLLEPDVSGSHWMGMSEPAR